MQEQNWQELLSKAKTEGGGAPLPEGSYTVQCVHAEIVPTKTNGAPMVKARFKVVGGPYDGRTIYNQFTITAENPQAMAIFFRHMACFGLDDAFFATPGLTQDAVAASLIGRTAVFDLGVKEFPPGSGAKRNEVKTVKTASGIVAAAPVVPSPIPQPAAATAVVPPAPVAAPVSVPVPEVPAPPAPPTPPALPEVPAPPAPVAGPDGVPAPPAAPF